MISTSAWNALKKASSLTLETVVECGLKCLNKKEECGAIHYHEETQACTMAQLDCQPEEEGEGLGIYVLTDTRPCPGRNVLE